MNGFDYNRYGNYIFEQTSVMPDDLNRRLKQYLEDDKILNKVAAVLPKLEDGEIHVVTLDSKDYDIVEGDYLYVKVDKSEPSYPKYSMWIVNDKSLFEKIDMGTLATILYQAGQEGSAVGYAANLLGSLVGVGDAGDAGTDEAAIAAIAGAITLMSNEKEIEPTQYFNRLSEVFENKYGESLKSFLETEFSGSAEVVALNLFRQEISPSVMRGLNLGSILLDVGLTVATFGGSAAVNASAKALQAGGRVASAASKAAKSTKAGAAVIRAGESALVGLKGVLARIPGWQALAGSQKLTHLGKHIKVGDVIKWKRGGKMVDHKVIKISQMGVQMQPVAGGAIFTKGYSDGKFLLSIDPGLANKILNSASINATNAGLALAGKKISDASAGKVEDGGDSSLAADAGELLGWYDALKADPAQYKSTIAESDMASLAEQVLDYKKGEGIIFKTTSGQQELAMALIITSLTPKSVKELNFEYSKLDASMTLSEVMMDELDGDVSILTNAYLDACLGEGDYIKAIRGIIARITKD